MYEPLMFVVSVSGFSGKHFSSNPGMIADVRLGSWTFPLIEVLLKKKLDPHFRETLSMAVNMSPANAHPHPSNVSEDLAYELETSTADGGSLGRLKRRSMAFFLFQPVIGPTSDGLQPERASTTLLFGGSQPCVIMEGLVSLANGVSTLGVLKAVVKAGCLI